MIINASTFSIGNVKPQLKKLWLNSQAIEKAIGRRAAIALTRYGSICRKEARRQIKIVAPTRNREKSAWADVRSTDKKIQKRGFQKLARQARAQERSSTPGGYPLSHTRDSRATIRNIQYHYDMNRRGVVIGPVKLNTVNFRNMGRFGGLVATPVPAILEYGGVTKKLETSWDSGKSWRRTDLRRGAVSYSKHEKRTGHKIQHRSRNILVRKRPTMALTFATLQSRNVLEASILYADKKLGGK